MWFVVLQHLVIHIHKLHIFVLKIPKNEIPIKIINELYQAESKCKYRWHTKHHT